MNDIFHAQTIIYFTNINFTQLKKNNMKIISHPITKNYFKKPSSLISYTILIYLDIQK